VANTLTLPQADGGELRNSMDVEGVRSYLVAAKTQKFISRQSHRQPGDCRPSTQLMTHSGPILRGCGVVRSQSRDQRLARESVIGGTKSRLSSKILKFFTKDIARQSDISTPTI